MMRNRSGSACRSGSPDPSHTLLAMGLEPDAAHCSIRLSLGYETTADDIDEALGLDEPVRTLIETHYLETIKAMVQAGLGWSMLPASMIDHSLVALDIRHRSTTRQLGTVVHRERTKSNAANAMIRLLSDYADRP